MKRRAEFLVEKRDGRREWLRASKLARSIHLALLSVHAAEGWRAVDLAEAVLAGIRGRIRRDTGHELAPLVTAELAEAVQQVLLATGFSTAAYAYARVGAERRRRKAVLATDAYAPADEFGCTRGACGVLPEAVSEDPAGRLPGTD